MIRSEWAAVKAWFGTERVTLGPQATRAWRDDPKHLLFVLARYKHAARLIGSARSVLEFGCGEGFGARILADGRRLWHGIDTDAEALAVAAETLPAPLHLVDLVDALTFEPDRQYDAVIAIDVIEHIPAADEGRLLDVAAGALFDRGVCVIGTPNETARAYQSEGSRLGHINLYDHERLSRLMRPHFKTVQMFGMNDETLTTGFLPMAHYLMAVGIGPRRALQEETTSFATGQCRACGGRDFGTAENGVACYSCGRRVTWQDQALRGEYDG